MLLLCVVNTGVEVDVVVIDGVELTRGIEASVLAVPLYVSSVVALSVKLVKGVTVCTLPLFSVRGTINK